MSGIIEILIWIVVIWFIFRNRSKKSQQRRRETIPNTRAGGPSGPAFERDSYGRRTITDEERAKLENYRQRKVPQSSAAETPAQAAVSSETRKTSIVERAKNNAAKLADDETLREIEEEHGHTEAEDPVPQEHSRNCQSLEKDVDAILAPEGLLGSTEDLILMGYEGNLRFERDFVGESLKMLEHISQVKR